MIMNTPSGSVIAVPDSPNVDYSQTIDASPTPKGYYDVPYIYSKNYYWNPTNLAPGMGDGGGTETLVFNQQYTDSIALEGDSDFILRKVSIGNIPPPAYNGLNQGGGTGLAGMAIPTTGFNFQDEFGNYYYPPNGTNASGVIQPVPRGLGPQLSILPEKHFPASGQIVYRIGPAVTNFSYIPFNATFDTAPWVSPLCVSFQGVKRFKGTADRKPNYYYTERAFTLVFSFNLVDKLLTLPYASFNLTPPRTYYIYVPNYDFELLAISVLDTTQQLAGGGSNTPCGFQARFYDANQVQMSNGFVNMQGDIATGAHTPQNCYPVPGVVYPANGTIRMDVRSLLGINNTGGVQTVYLKGVQRIPCSNS